MTGPVYITVSPPSQKDLPFPATWGGSTKKDGMLQPAMAGCGESLSGGDWRILPMINIDGFQVEVDKMWEIARFPM
jgi:hypothetical protein